MRAPRTCLDCGRHAYATRCRICQLQRESHRNARRATYYDSTHRKLSKAARKAQPFCSLCQALNDLTWDHEHGQVECRSCNSSHRRNPT